MPEDRAPEGPGDHAPAPLWPYALELYARPGVAALCLEAQDTLGADVPLLLWGAWAAARGHVLTDADMGAARSLADRWRGPVIAPLRHARRALKDLPGGEALRQTVKAAELEAERLYMAALEALAGSWPAPSPCPTALRDNLARLLPPDAGLVTERLHKALS
ncbi:TIGR02444 family protein [Nitrospirillum sp. BR 11828]|uniref:TIGR02444 family protein n=1 Tax=Nitrospirillum sp. BR 11828 TaxID=3104325 RepID=UPI002AC9FE0E|nr:TIGR02444 family protein [Nitrospirillum sp. BR 11828]MDZ5647491.1 TIGR02444 family protein [Nitrospirillum sp. BR 11828]